MNKSPLWQNVAEKGRNIRHGHMVLVIVTAELGEVTLG